MKYFTLFISHGAYRSAACPSKTTALPIRCLHHRRLQYYLHSRMSACKIKQMQGSDALQIMLLKCKETGRSSAAAETGSLAKRASKNRQTYPEHADWLRLPGAQRCGVDDSLCLSQKSGHLNSFLDCRRNNWASPLSSHLPVLSLDFLSCLERNQLPKAPHSNQPPNTITCGCHIALRNGPNQRATP